VADQSAERVRTASLLALVTLSIVARLWLVFHRPIWHDEAFTEWAARLPTPALLSALRQDSGPPLFYVLERPLARSVSSPRNEWLPRLLPFTATLLLLAAVRTLPPGPARRWWIVLCSSYALVNLYAAEARAYALLGLASLAVFLLAGVLPESPRARWGLLFAAITALWLHYLAFFTVASALAVALAGRRFRSALVLLAALAAFVPWLPVLRTQPPEAMAWMRETPGAAASGFVSALGGVGRIPAPFGIAPTAATLAGLFLGAALAALLVTVARSDEGVRNAVLFVAVALGLALAVTLWRPVAFAGRAEMAVLPVWMWAAARAAGRNRPAAVAAGLAAAAGGLATLAVVLGPHPRSTPSSAAASVARLARPADTVLAGPGFYLPALVEAGRGRLSARVLALPQGDAAHPGWFVAWPLSPDDVRRATDAAAAVGSGRLYLLLPPAYNQPALMDPLTRSGTLRELVRQPDGVLTVWSGPPRRPTGEAPTSLR